MTTIANFNQFVNYIVGISDIVKRPSSFKDPPIKKVNDLFTNVMNKLYVKSPNLLNRYFDAVYSIYGDIDSYSLLPKATNTHNRSANINVPAVNVINNSYVIDNNRFNVGSDNGYFIFKGGNVIKYWTLFKYFDKLNVRMTNLQNILDQQLDFNEKGGINSYSDFDFTYYVDNLDNNKYKNLLGHLMYRMQMLRDRLDADMESTPTGFSDHELHYRIQHFLEKDGKAMRDAPVQPTFHQNIAKKTDVVNSIITKNNQNDLFIVNYPEHNKSMNISFNNCIITSDQVDFDLLRIKMAFNANNLVRHHNFKAEIFDLTVMRPQDEHRAEFCESIHDNTVIIQSAYNDRYYNIRTYNVNYTLKDILNVLFVSNQPYNTFFLWLDKKYSKRIVRLGILYAQYLDTIHDQRRKRVAFFKMYLLFNFVSKFFENKREFDTADLAQKLRLLENLVFSSIIDLSKHLPNDLFVDVIDTLLTNSTRILENRFQMSDIMNMVHNNDFINFIILIALVFIKKIYVDQDIQWCNTNLYGRNSTQTIDLCEFKKETVNFIQLFCTYVFVGTASLTTLFETYITNNLLSEIVQFQSVFQIATEQEGGRSEISDIVQVPRQVVESKPKPIQKETQNETQQNFVANMNTLKSYVELDRMMASFDKSSLSLIQSYQQFITHFVAFKQTLDKHYVNGDQYKLIYLNQDKTVQYEIQKTVKLIDSNVYENSLDNLVDTHAKLITKLFHFEDTEMKDHRILIPNDVFEYM